MFISGCVRAALPLLSVGVSLWAVVPSAFVVFPSEAVKALPSLSKSEIIAAGPFHNVILWSLLFSSRSLLEIIVEYTPFSSELVTTLEGLAVVQVSTVCFVP